MQESDRSSSNLEREQRILDAASRLILHYGYDKTTVSDIAREAGVSKGAIYLHYDSKETLFEALLRREILLYGQDWIARFEADDSEWSFVSMFKLMLQTMQHHPFMVALLKRDPHMLGSFLRRDSSLLKQKGTANTEMFRILQQVGATRSDINAQVIAYLLNVFAYGLVSAEDVVDPEAIPPFEDAVDGLAKLLDRGLAPEGGGDREAAKAIVEQVVRGLQARLEQITQVRE
ncbi:MAG: TetR/AcrR family transcriptional regulator [Anaerolineae bacterium]|nr:TetR/AcrR family transcriptional regulator [Anaerolineae bacterium]